MKIGNYTPNYIETAMNMEGTFDIHNKDASELKTDAKLIQMRRYGCNNARDSENNLVHQYEFVIIPNFGFLASADPLMKDCELKLSFDRSKGSIPLIDISTDADADVIDGIEIIDCVAITEWISSPGLRDYFSSIDNTPIVYQYEEIDVNVISLPTNRSNFRLENVKGGNVPNYIFAGIIESEALNGNKTLCPTKFERHNVEEFNIMINGSSCNGYPITIKNGSPTMAVYKLIETTNRLCNMSCGSTPRYLEFINNWLWSHKFEAEGTQGWISFTMKLSEAFATDKPMSMVIWTVSPCAITLDKFHQVEKLNP